MENMNFVPYFVAPFVSLVVGMIWYNPKVFGNAWMREARITFNPEEKFNMVKSFGLCLLYSFFICWILGAIVIHQAGALSATFGIEGIDPSVLKNYMDAYGDTYRTFKHGALHGTMAGLFFALPVVGTSAIYEKRSFKYVLIVGGYWVVTCAIMGGILCAWK
ncbi:DUF1761 domain-containing protein [Flavobacterium sp.]|uniref:DUF1761 domain-containing protein n=1 Tax=Flavobacterium sp. TaxID=239 RepID=UPI0011FED352|nr:DUF1761 domain-containing protein [Flavobacterium sp.]RZJ73492.1 MAG: DUF1761 domain-containing protein [Flavobacterium sp.]